MELSELLFYRTEILNESRDADGYISDAGVIESCLPLLNETKYLDTTDVTDIYDPLEDGSVKINAYVCNESGERLQLFLVNEESINSDATEEQLKIAQKSVYEKQFNRVLSFVKKSFKNQIGLLLQDGSPAWVLVHQLQDAEFIEQIDVIEIFLISATATIESRGAAPSAKMLEFDDDSIKVSYAVKKDERTKNIVIIKRLIDLNFLYNVHIAQGSRYPLVIDFTAAPFNHPIPFLPAANEKAFDSYLCALPGELLSELYKRFSSRLLEKNVRSFLQLKGVNKGMQETISGEPEKFIAYNNGLTITATACEMINVKGTPHIKALSDFQIVNGGQTTATLYFSKKLGLDIQRVRVMAKVNVAKDASEEALDELISNISTFSNAQSKVSKVDLRARSPQLVKLKSISESILTPTGKKWFFERAKGEYATMMRINAGKKQQLEKLFPKERRFTKEELAKYHSAWGIRPYAVKKGGEKIFRLFLEEIAGEGKGKKASVINRAFYEDLIARIILFRELEKIYGAGNNSLGQLRSTVVPYSLSALYAFTTGDNSAKAFDLLKIWKMEKLDDNLKQFFLNLMTLMNKVVKKYSLSEDIGEYSKKPELWNEVVGSYEINNFMTSDKATSLLSQYLISQSERKRREKELMNDQELDFVPLLNSAEIFDRGAEFYKSILKSQADGLAHSEVSKLKGLIGSIQKTQVVETEHIEFDKELLNRMSINQRDVFSDNNASNVFAGTVDFILQTYNSAILAGKNVQDAFDNIKDQANKKGIQQHMVFSEIGKLLNNRKLPSMVQVKQASEYYKTL